MRHTIARVVLIIAMLVFSAAGLELHWPVWSAIVPFVLIFLLLAMA